MMFETDKINHFCSRINETITSRILYGTNGVKRYPDQKICIVSHFEQYVEKTKDLRKDQNFLISFVKLQKRIATSAISRWCVTVLINAGVDLTVIFS